VREKIVAGFAAVVSLDPPDRGDDVAVDAEGLLGGAERPIISTHQCLAVGDALIVDQEPEIIPDRRLELWLHLGEPEHFFIGLGPIERCFDDLLPHSRLERVLFQTRNAIGKARGESRSAEQGCRHGDGMRNPHDRDPRLLWPPEE
jgi:hypothetical protein